MMSEMKVGSIEVEQEIELCLGYRQTPQRGQQKERKNSSRTMLTIMINRGNMVATVDNIIQIRDN